jgi:SNF2 family DNA or RNA helicase
MVASIQRGGFATAGEGVRRAAVRCAVAVRSLVRPFVLQRHKALVASSLPARREEVLLCSSVGAQWDVYKAVLDDNTRYANIFFCFFIFLIASHCAPPRSSHRTDRFALLTLLLKACNHPDLVTAPAPAAPRPRRRHSRPARAGVREVSDDDMRSSSSSSDGSSSDSDSNSSDSDSESDQEQAQIHNFRPRPRAPVPATSALSLPLDTRGHAFRSGKLLVLLRSLREWRARGHRVLLFSQTVQCLDLLEAAVRAEGYAYLRMDGHTSIKARPGLVAQFNRDDDCFVFLLTTRVGGLGLNLTAADRVVIYDPHWNPAVDAQAAERCYRLGQTRPVVIYRLALRGTIEERVVQRQAFKQVTASGVLTDSQGTSVSSR